MRFFFLSVYHIRNKIIFMTGGQKSFLYKYMCFTDIVGKGILVVFFINFAVFQRRALLCHTITA